MLLTKQPLKNLFYLNPSMAATTIAASASLLLSLSPPPPPPPPPPFLTRRKPSFFSPSSSSLRCRRRRRRRTRLRTIAVASPAASTPISDEFDEAEALTLESESPSSSSSSSSDSFSWRDHWYPVSLVEDLDPRLPTPFQLLNRDIELWNNPNSGEWVALEDRCPHRLAPLSEGRIDDGCLQCSYHGWSFDGSGSCTRIPQASSEGPEARAIRSPRASVAKLPTLVSQGLLFVWPVENGWEKAVPTLSLRCCLMTLMILGSRL